MSTALVKYSEIMPFEIRQAAIEATKAAAIGLSSKLLRQADNFIAEKIADRMDGKMREMLSRSIRWLVIAKQNGCFPEYKNA